MMEIAVKENLRFRHALRKAVQADHDATERVFARFDQEGTRHLSWFLAAQRAGLWALYESCGNRDRLLCGPALIDLIERLDFDLAIEDVRPRSLEPDCVLDCLAVDYLVLGSRLGTEAIRRKHFAEVPREQIPTYFLAGSDGRLWKKHCDALDGIAPGSSRARRIFEDTRKGFALFERAAAAQDSPG
ncbi:hypothetical protein [Celeribacter indicus]|nr:hypothetical protein [Celeribacter indicus]